MLIEYGNTVAKPDWNLNEKIATGYSRIYYVLAGDVTYEAENHTKHKLKPGYLYVLPSAAPYKATRNTAVDFETTYLHVSFEEDRVTTLIEIFPEPGSCLMHYLMAIQTAISEQRTELLERLADAFDQFLRDHPSFVPASSIQNVVRQYVQKHLAEKISVEELSGLMSYHPNYFIHLFRDETGYTPHQYILQQRMQYAALLINKNMSNQAVCQACGYEDSSTFTRAFRQYYGVTPQKYKSGFRRP